MNKKFEPFLAHSELTDCIYIIDKDDKYEVTEQCIKAMKATNRMLKWIPVSEKLPEKNGIYIASYEDAVALLNWFNGKWFFYPSNPAREETGTIIAWMPLPQPYKAESEG